MSHQLINNTLEFWSKEYTGPKFHAVLCDPPYGLKFMGKDWDVVSAKEWGEALLPHLYPGALCLMFGGTRTWHKLATGMEEAGFEIWDTLMWLYGQGFPKGQDISKLIDKKNGNSREVIGPNPHARPNQDGIRIWVGDRPGKEQSHPPISTPGSVLSAPWSGHKTCALKPAWEPILAFRVPAKRTYAELALEYGSGCLNIDGARIEGQPRATGTVSQSAGISVKEIYGKDNRTSRQINYDSSLPTGRYPANLLLDEESAAALDEQSGTLTSGKWDGHRNKPKTENTYGEFTLQDERSKLGDSGGASRFFYCAKAGTAERNAGCDALDAKAAGLHDDDNYRQPGERKANHTAPLPRKNHHPTVKPLALTQYLATLLLPPASVSPRRLLVPFAGSGSEIIGALKAGWDEVVGIEQDTDQGYCRIAEARIAHHIGEA